MLRMGIPERWWVLGVISLALLRATIFLVRVGDNPVQLDEGIYVVALASLTRGEDIVQVGDQLGYGPTIFTTSWLLLIPARLGTILGLGPWDALRGTSILFSTLSVLLIVNIVFFIRGKTATSPQEKVGVALLSTAGVALLILMLLPSYQLWGSLALRDASSIFALSLVAWGFSRLSFPVSRFGLTIALVFIFVGIASLYISRAYLALPVSAAIVIAAILPPLRTRAIVVLLLVALVGAANMTGIAVRDYLPRSTATVEVDTSLIDGSQVPLPPKPMSALSLIDSRVSNLWLSREKFREGAESAYPTNYCRDVSGTVDTALCEGLHLPIGLYRFLLTPNLLESGTSASPQRIFGGLENIIWLGVFLLALGTLITRYARSTRYTVFLVLFLGSAIAGYALVSGNEGTAFRHKSQFLWAWCLVIALGYGWRPWVRSLVQRKQPVS